MTSLALTFNPSCLDLKLGPYQIHGFATYPERQINPNQSDLDLFNVTKVTQFLIQGLVKVKNTAHSYFFEASCSPVTFKGYPELRLKFNAEASSLVNNCSGIYNFHQNGSVFGAALYLGGPSLITSDYNFTICEKGRYGLLIPPQ